MVGRHHGNIMATSWQHHGNIMATSWQHHGNNNIPSNALTCHL
jgi:hypothetical protein